MTHAFVGKWRNKLRPIIIISNVRVYNIIILLIVKVRIIHIVWFLEVCRKTEKQLRLFYIKFEHFDF